MNFFDKLKGELNLGEEELNKKTIQIRLFYPNTLELNNNSSKLIENFIVNGTLNIVRKQKGITVFGRILKENFSKIHECYCTFKNEDNTPIQKFILYTPGYHYVHFYTFTRNIIQKINNEIVKENWGLEPIVIDECNVVMLTDVVRYSCILLFNKENDISIIKTNIDAIKGYKHPIRAFLSEYSNKEMREVRKKRTINKNQQQTTLNSPLAPTTPSSTITQTSSQQLPTNNSTTTQTGSQQPLTNNPTTTQSTTINPITNNINKPPTTTTTTNNTIKTNNKSTNNGIKTPVASGLRK
ncbi:hypothetical protein ACTFIZ_004869 [Dictyostelium cf. discoideum]